jgi:hypothetical protein
VGPRAVFDAVVKRKIPSPCRESDPKTQHFVISWFICGGPSPNLEAGRPPRCQLSATAYSIYFQVLSVYSIRNPGFRLDLFPHVGNSSICFHNLSIKGKLIILYMGRFACYIIVDFSSLVRIKIYKFRRIITAAFYEYSSFVCFLAYTLVVICLDTHTHTTE